jgi:hypothetical protein
VRLPASDFGGPCIERPSVTWTQVRTTVTAARFCRSPDARQGCSRATFAPPGTVPLCFKPQRRRVARSRGHP